MQKCFSSIACIIYFASCLRFQVAKQLAKYASFASGLEKFSLSLKMSFKKALKFFLAYYMNPVPKN